MNHDYIRRGSFTPKEKNWFTSIAKTLLVRFDRKVKKTKNANQKENIVVKRLDQVKNIQSENF